MRYTKARRGLALLLSLLMLPLMVLLAFGLTTMGMHNLSTAKNRENSKQSAYMAEAGCEEGLQRLKADIDYQTESGWSLTSPSTPFLRSATGVSEVASVRIWNNHYGDAVMTVPVTGARVPIGYAYILATAAQPQGIVTRQAAMLCKLIGSAPSPWNYGAVGFTSVKLGGTKTLVDSYDSSQGTFTATRVDFASATAGLGGNIASGTAPDVSSTAGTVEFNSGNRVAGRVDILAGGSTGGTAGVQFVASSVLTTPIYNRPVVVPSFPSVAIGTGGVLAPGQHYTGLMNQAITLNTSGDYVFDDFVSRYITITPGAKVNLYVTGQNAGSVDLTMLNVIVNPAGGNDPEYVPNPLSPARNVTLYVGAGISALTLQGSKSYVSCRFYAPHTDVLFRSANFHLFGSISGKSVENRGNMEISYDRNMQEPNIPPDAAPRYRQRM